MKKWLQKIVNVGIVLSLILLLSNVIPTEVFGATPSSIPIYRLYCPVNGEHLYTSDVNERNVLYTRYGWGYEGVAWYADTSGTPVYRLYNSGLKNHLYTTDLNEVKSLLKIPEWSLDNNGEPLYYSNGSVPIYRVYNYALNGMHHLTTDGNEYNVLPGHGWKQEGVSLYARAIGSPVRTQYYPSPLQVKSRYSYSLKILNQYETYSEGRIILALMTDNPNAAAIQLSYDGNDMCYYAGVLYDDIKYLDDTMSTSEWQAIKSQTGYVRTISFEEPGTKTVIINEVVDGVKIEVARLTINVQDREQAKNAWYDSVIESETNSSMTNLEKMQALEQYVLSNFKYDANDGEYLVFLTSKTGAWWEVKEIDCWDATTIMCEFAGRIGLGSEWTYAGYLSHYYATVYIDGTRYGFDACPSSSTNIVTSWPYVLE